MLERVCEGGGRGGKNKNKNIRVGSEGCILDKGSLRTKAVSSESRVGKTEPDSFHEHLWLRLANVSFNQTELE